MLSNFALTSFAAPLALFGLLGLPLIWWILRATPPKPQMVSLPSFQLLDAIRSAERTPEKTPLWLILLRLLLVTAMILALAQPERSQSEHMDGDASNVLFIVDNGWTSAGQWRSYRAAMLGTLKSFPESTKIHFLLTAPKTLQTEPAEGFTPRQARSIIQSLEAVGWLPDREDALERLSQSALQPDLVYWFSDGLHAYPSQQTAPVATWTAFPQALDGAEGVFVYIPDVGAHLRIQSVAYDEGKLVVETELNPLIFGLPMRTLSLSAMTVSGLTLETSDLRFDTATGLGRAVFELPIISAQRINYFRVNDNAQAGNIWLNDPGLGPKFVGIVSAGNTTQPLLSDAHYIEKALPDTAILLKADIETLLRRPPSIIVISDSIIPSQDERDALQNWVQEGGILVRFASEDMGESVNSDPLISVQVRRNARKLDSALNWESPQSLSVFPDTSPFFGLEISPEIRVQKQILARASPELAQQTWANLADGSPLVTFRNLGGGQIVFFHLGATPDWSNLVLSELFPQMWSRLISLAKSGNAAPTGDGSYTPFRVLDAYGRFNPPSDISTPLKRSEMTQLPISERHPAGVYRGSAGDIMRNVGTNTTFTPINQWPEKTVFISGAAAQSLSLTRLFFLLCAIFILIETLVFLFFVKRDNGLFRAKNIAHSVESPPAFGRITRPAFALLASIILILTWSGDTALAQSSSHQTPPRLGTQSTQSEAEEAKIDAALGMRFGYIPTGEPRLDTMSARGLAGLSRVLFLRTSVEPESPHAVELETDSLELYPLLYWPMPSAPRKLSDLAIKRLNAYLRSGGALIVDTRSGGVPGTPLPQAELAIMLEGLDIPPLRQVPSGHVINRAFYLIDTYPGRFETGQLWIDTHHANPDASGVSRVFIGDADWVSAWATDARGRSMAANDGGRQGREYAYRFGVNLVMYILTGTYKSDQVHLPALIERLGEEANIAISPPDSDNDNDDGEG